MNASKCIWFAQEIKLLGHIVSGKTIKMDDDKVKAMLQRTAPLNVKDVQIFLGCTGYYRSLIKDYAQMAKPLFDLIKKDTPFVWGEQQEKAFVALKTKLSEYPVLRLPVLDREFSVQTDCSGIALGAVLAQKDPEDGKEYVVC